MQYYSASACVVDREAMLSPKRLHTDQRFCPHCSNFLSYKTFRAHKWLYYDETTGSWYDVLRAPEDEVICDVEEEEVRAPPLNFEYESTGTSPPLSPCLSGDVDLAQGVGECDNSDGSPPHSEAAVSYSEGK